MPNPEERKMSITSWEGDQESVQKKDVPAQASAENPKDSNSIESPQRKFSITSWEGDQEKIRIGKTLEKVPIKGGKLKEKLGLKSFTGASVGALTGYLLLKGLFALPMATLNWLIKNVPEKIGGVTINPIDKKAYFEAYNQLANLSSHKKN